MYKHTKMCLYILWEKNRDKLTLLPLTEFKLHWMSVRQGKGNRPKSLQSGEMDCQKDRNTSSTEIYLLLEDMFSDWQIVLHGDCVCVASSHLRRSCGIVVVLIEIVLFRCRPSWQLDVHIQIILWFVSVDPVLCYSLIDHYSSLERRKVGEIKKGKGYKVG